jgi:hypothetical protein
MRTPGNDFELGPTSAVFFGGSHDVPIPWARAADANAWSGGLSLTATTRVPALRVQAGIEQRSGGSYLAILRLTASID